MTAKIKLNAASGGGSFSLQAPSSSSNNRVITLPDIADGTLLTSSSGVGITMADQFRINTSVALNNGENFLTSNWERVDSSGQGTLTGSGGMTESGGIFTFPSTGIYKVEWQGYFEETGRDDVNSFGIYITTDNSSYSSRASSIVSIEDVGTYSYGNCNCQTFVDVTDVTQVKVKFRIYSSATVSLDGSSSENRNCATFIRLGDT